MSSSASHFSPVCASAISSMASNASGMSSTGNATKMHSPIASSIAVAICRFLRQLDLALRLQRVDGAADAEDVGGDRVAGGVVGAHACDVAYVTPMPWIGRGS